MRGDSVAVRCVHHHHTALCRSRNIDIIHTDPGPAHNFQIGCRRKQRLCDFCCRPNSQPVIRSNNSLQFFWKKAGFDIRLNTMCGKNIYGILVQFIANQNFWPNNPILF